MTCGDRAESTNFHRGYLRDEAVTSPFAEEAAAMQLALKKATTNSPGHSLTICTNSHSFLKETDSSDSSPEITPKRSPGFSNPMWVLDHKGNPGNELTDIKVKAAATSTRDPPKPTSYDITRFLISRKFADPPPAYAPTAEVYGGFSRSKDSKSISNHADAVLLAHLRAGQLPLIKASLISSTPRQTHCVPFAKKSRKL